MYAGRRDGYRGDLSAGVRAGSSQWTAGAATPSVPWTADVLDAINVAALALMIVVSAQLARTAVGDWATAALAVVSAVLLIRYRVNSAWLILGGGLIGFILRGFRGGGL